MRAQTHLTASTLATSYRGTTSSSRASQSPGVSSSSLVGASICALFRSRSNPPVALPVELAMLSRRRLGLRLPFPPAGDSIATLLLELIREGKGKSDSSALSELLRRKPKRFEELVLGEGETKRPEERRRMEPGRREGDEAVEGASEPRSRGGIGEVADRGRRCWLSDATRAGEPDWYEDAGRPSFDMDTGGRSWWVVRSAGKVKPSVRPKRLSFVALDRVVRSVELLRTRPVEGRGPKTESMSRVAVVPVLLLELDRMGKSAGRRRLEDVELEDEDVACDGREDSEDCHELGVIDSSGKELDHV